jgi:hypothetical protein
MRIDTHLPVRRSGNTRQIDEASCCNIGCFFGSGISALIIKPDSRPELIFPDCMGDLEEDLENLAPIQLQGRGFAK